MRVVSLLPSATELLCAIGGQEFLVGRSHECDYPPAVTRLPTLTSQKTSGQTSNQIDQQVRSALAGEHSGASLYHLDEQQLRDLKPDVILTQDLCAVCSIDLNTVRRIATSMDPPPRIVSLNPQSMEDVFDDLLRVGDAVRVYSQAQAVMVDLRAQYWSARDYVNPYIEGPEVAFLEWMDPLFAAGHWTPQLIIDAGGRHSLNAPGQRSRQIAPEDLVQSMPERLIICPCGYDLHHIKTNLHERTSQRWWRRLPAVQDNHVVLVDGNQMFNRPGPRLVDAFCWLVGWLNNRPEVIPKDFPAEMLATA